MSSLDEKRVYGATSGHREVVVATGLGVVSVAVSGDSIGEFGIVHRCSARDVGVVGGLVAVATDEAVLLDDGDDDAFRPVGFGPAVAVSSHEGRLLAADDTGRVAECGDPTAGAPGWTDLGRVGDVRGLDGPLVAAADGVYRLAGGDLSPAGLGGVTDVAARGPLAATDDGLYSLGNGWLRDLEGRFDAVAADRASAAAAGERGVFVRRDSEWAAADAGTDEPVVDVGVVDGTYYGVTSAGTFVVDAGGGPRSQPLGLRDVGGVAVRDPADRNTAN
jgi:hypothetical protein